MHCMLGLGPVPTKVPSMHASIDVVCAYDSVVLGCRWMFWDRIRSRAYLMGLVGTFCKIQFAAYKQWR